MSLLLLLESLHPDAEALLHGAEHEIVHAQDPNSPECSFGKVRAILTRGRGRISDELLKRCPGVEAIARAGVGLDNIDTAAAARRGVPVVFAPGANADTVAEHTLALILDLVRGITRQARAVAAGRWEDRTQYNGHEVRGQTLGILGYGHIGKRVGRLAATFGMHPLIVQHPRRELPETVDVAPLAEVLARADVLTLHLPLRAGTEGILGAPELAAMREGALLVNTSRGALIDPVALRAALASGQLGGFAADVLDQEPPSADDP
ncbi:MAG: NAD(P)-dependent oxidoreductase, partial [Planctomycetota bacterium]